MTPTSRESIPPPSNPLPSFRPAAPRAAPPLLAAWSARVSAFVEAMGGIGILAGRTLAALPRRPFETASTIYQIEALGVRSVGIVTVSSIFVGMVMTVQFAYGLQRFGGLEYIPRVVILAFVRELGPTLMAIIVGGRIGSGIAAEVGAMNVTEQVDAIRALGGDPAKKLVLPRVAAAMIVLPLLSVMSDAGHTRSALRRLRGVRHRTSVVHPVGSRDRATIGPILGSGQDADLRIYHRDRRVPLRAHDDGRHRGRRPEHHAHRRRGVDRDPGGRLLLDAHLRLRPAGLTLPDRRRHGGRETAAGPPDRTRGGLRTGD
jgi:hypothetical protein